MSRTFQALPVEIAAEQYTGSNDAEIDVLVGDDRWAWADPATDQSAGLRLTESWSSWADAEPGMWIVRHTTGRLELLEAEEFARSYGASA